MKVQLPINKIERIKELIEEYPDYSIAHDGGKENLFGWLHRNGKSRAFSVLYEIYTIKGAGDFANSLSALGKWLESDALYVRLFFDYPNGKGQFKCSAEYLPRLLVLLPKIKGVLNVRN